MPKSVRIVITGVGPLVAGGSGKEEVWSSIKNKRTGLIRKTYHIGDEHAGEYYVHEIKNFDIGNYDIDRGMLNEIREWKDGEEIEDLYYFLATAKMAIEDSGLKIDEKSGDAIGLILVHENIGQDHFYRKVIEELSYIGNRANEKPMTKKDFLDKFYKKFRRTGYELQSFMALYHVAKVLGVHGYSLFLNNACASGLFAIEAAADIVRSGKCKQVIVSAVDRSSVFKQMWFDEVKMLAKDGLMRPFAVDRDGFTIGDGGVSIVIEDSETAKRRNAFIYAEYAGGGFALEGWKVTYPDINGNTYKDCMTKAMTLADVAPKDVDLIVPHGVATNITDRYEANAITGIFDREPVRPLVSALKPYTGHTLGSTALLETAIMLIAIQKGSIPPTLNCEKHDEKLNMAMLQSMSDAARVKVMMKTACGFAGYDGACVFKRYR